MVDENGAAIDRREIRIWLGCVYRVDSLAKGFTGAHFEHKYEIGITAALPRCETR